MHVICSLLDLWRRKEPTHEHRGIAKPPANVTRGPREENQRLLDAFGEIIQELILLSSSWRLRRATRN